MKFLLKLSLLIVVVLLPRTYALASNEPRAIVPSCLDINSNVDRIEQFITSGEFRTTVVASQKELPIFDYSEQQSFKKYLAYAAKLINARNPNARRLCPVVTPTVEILKKQKSWPQITTVSDLIAPFELRHSNSKKAILLIHGLTDSPFLFHDLAAHFYQLGFTVRTLLIPGHSTAPSDLINVDMEHWQQATRYAIKRTLDDFEQIYLGGYSAGGTLILDYLMSHRSDNKINGVFLWAPALKSKSNLAWLAKYIDYIPFVDWISKEADIDFAKYESFPFNAAAQIEALMERNAAVMAGSERIMPNVPLFVVASEHDQTIDTSATLALMQQWHDPVTRKHTRSDTVIYYGDATNASTHLPRSIGFINPKCKGNKTCQSVMNVAHTAPTNSPDNPHYGVQGKYRNCSHYLADMPKFRVCKQSADVLVGEKTPQNLQRSKVLKRLTYNPFFDGMLIEVDKFLAKTSYP